MDTLVSPVPNGQPTFLNLPRCEDLATLTADVAIIGVPFGVPQDLTAARFLSSTAPAAIREQSLQFAARLAHYDFDFGGDLFAGRSVTIVDCGDVAMTPGDHARNNATTTVAIRAILDRGAIPIVLGGDDAIPIPVMRAYDQHGPLCVVQIDAHIDWRDEINGVREGLSCTMRRASELPWVTAMAQIGIRGLSSARPAEYAAAAAFGSVIIGARELRRLGVDEALRRVPDAARYFITFDADALDPSIAPGVTGLACGGLSYVEGADLLRGVAAKGRVVGFDFVEVVPSADIANLTSLHAARLILDLIGSLAYAGQIGSS
jgi:agmatinase